MYEIWSLGHKPFEGYTNAVVNNEYIHTMHILSTHDIIMFECTDNGVGEQWASSGSAPWLSQGCL